MDKEGESQYSKMWTDILLQALFFISMAFMILFAQGIPQKFFSRIQFRKRGNVQAKRHFIQGAQLLAQARSATDRSSASTLAKSAEAEAEKAIALDPKDAAAHILKALALDIQGFRTSAIDSIDVALSPIAVKSLSEQEKADALFKRAELRIGVSKRGQVDSVITDLVESVRLRNDNAKALCLLGECYEKKGMKENAQKAYEDAISVEPNYCQAKEALARLCS